MLGEGGSVLPLCSTMLLLPGLEKKRLVVLLCCISARVPREHLRGVGKLCRGKVVVRSGSVAMGSAFAVTD